MGHQKIEEDFQRIMEEVDKKKNGRFNYMGKI